MTGSNWKSLNPLRIVYWARIENDSASLRRWEGGAWSQSGSTFYKDKFQPNFIPVFFKSGRVGTVSGGSSTGGTSHSVPLQATLRYSSHTTHATGYQSTRPGPSAYFGYYSGTWGQQWSLIRFSGSPSASKVTGGTLTFRVAHTFWNGGADINLVFGSGQSKRVHVPKSGGVTVTLNQAQARALAGSKSLEVRPVNPTARQDYGYLVANSFKAVLRQSG